MNQMLRDRNGIVIGQLRWSGNNLRLYNRDGIYQGYYRKTNDMTYNRDGKMMGRGNMVVSLLSNK